MSIRTISSAVVAIMLLATMTKAHAQNSGPTPVGVDAVVSEELAQTMPVLGRLVAERAGVVASRINGPIGVFNVEVGDRVEAGDILVTLVDNALLALRDLWRAELLEAESGVGTREAEVSLRQQELKRLEDLKSSSAYSPARVADKRQEVAIAESALGEQQAAVGIARANLRLAEINLYNAEIRAPYSGVVVARHTEVGSYVAVGAPVVTLIDDRSLEIEADVPTDRVAGLTTGTLVSFKLPGDTPATAIVRATIPDENPLTRTRSVRFTASLANDVTLAANQSVTLQIPIGAPREVVTVHKDAILERGGQRTVYLIVDGKAEVRPVTLGVATGERFEVINGLKPGDVVVVRGNERLRPGQEVVPNDQLPAPDDAGSTAG